MHHVILGAGPAGITAAETIRSVNRKADITVVSGEAEPPYSRMAIPYLLQGNIEEQGTYLRQNARHYDGLGVKIVHGRAGGVDAQAKRLHLADGKALTYDRLLIATGANPILPPMDGASLPGVHTCWTLADAREIMKIVGKGTPVVLVGAGFIGSIILEALVRRGAALTVIEREPRMVARMLDETAGGMLGRWCEGKGVRILTGQRVERISKADASKGTGGLRIWLGGGEALAAELVVMAVGVRPNTGFLVGSGVDVRTGIRVDDHLRTTAADVYAAGDCAEAHDISTGYHDVLAIQPVAVEHGRIAGLNMAGRPTPHRGSLNMNVLDTLGLVSTSFGQWQGAAIGYSARTLDERANKYLRLEFEGDRLVGGQSVGTTEHIGLMRGLIQTGLRLGHWRDRLLKSPERLAEAYIAVAQGIGAVPPSVKTPAAA